MLTGFMNKNKNNSPDNIKLGDLVKDRITGYEGIVECIAEWLNSCRRISIRPINLKEDGTIQDMLTFDAPQIKIITPGYFDKPIIKEGEKTGGPSFSPARND